DKTTYCHSRENGNLSFNFIIHFWIPVSEL
ncbi:unnamed protein product, partial [marine sediment metagenome]